MTMESCLKSSDREDSSEESTSVEVLKERIKDKLDLLGMKLLSVCNWVLQFSIAHSVYLLSGESVLVGVIAFFGVDLLQMRYLLYRIPNLMHLIHHNRDKAREEEMRIRPEVSLIFLGVFVVLRLMVLHS